MKKNNKPHILEVYCKCGFKLARYKKGAGRRLVKIHKDRILQDFSHFINNYPEHTDLLCPSCKKRIATVKKINGKFVNKLNQGSIGIIK